MNGPYMHIKEAKQLHMIYHFLRMHENCVHKMYDANHASVVHHFFFHHEIYQFQKVLFYNMHTMYILNMIYQEQIQKRNLLHDKAYDNLKHMPSLVLKLLYL